MRLENVYIASVYAFIPLFKLQKKYKQEFEKLSAPIDPHADELYPKTHCRYYELKKSQTFFYSYNYQGVDYTREVLMRTYLFRYEQDFDDSLPKYYLVVGTGIDKVFPNTGYSQNDLCTEQDITQLKKAFYGTEHEGFYYPQEQPTLYFLPAWLNSLAKDVSGIDPEGRFGRHYIVNVVGVNIDVDVPNIQVLNDNFEREYYALQYHDLQNVIPDCNNWAYGLIFGNDNYRRIPPQQVSNVILSPFSNNLTERTYSANTTIVSIRSHYPYSIIDRPEEGHPFSTDFQYAQNIHEICSVMHLNHKLKSIRDMFDNENPSEIKEALSKMTALMDNRPTGLRELDGKFDYIYQTIGINRRFESVRQIGEMSADGVNINNTIRLNIFVAILTAATVFIGFLQLFLSCNNSNSFIDMCNCLCHCTDAPMSCCAVIAILLVVILLVVCIIVLTIYRVKSYWKLEKMAEYIKRLE